MTIKERYSRNWLFVTPEEQDAIKNIKILFGGVGLASVIAETALRFGFENFVLLDGDDVSLSNLNRQNYTMADIGKSKAEMTTNRLKSINPKANIEYHNVFLDENNIDQFITDEIDIAINCIDYDTVAPFIFDEACFKKNIPVIHPGNRNWAAITFIVKHNSLNLQKLKTQAELADEDYLIYVIKFLDSQLKNQNHDVSWYEEARKRLEVTMQQYKDATEKGQDVPPPSVSQLSIGSGLVAAQTTSLMFDIICRPESIKYFPHVYYHSTR